MVDEVVVVDRKHVIRGGRAENNMVDQLVNVIRYLVVRGHDKMVVRVGCRAGGLVGGRVLAKDQLVAGLPLGVHRKGHLMLAIITLANRAVIDGLVLPVFPICQASNSNIGRLFRHTSAGKAILV